MSQTVYVRMEIEIQITLPIPIPEDEIDEDGQLKDGKFREAATTAAVSWIHQSGEIDVSADLGIPFKTIARGDEPKSLADVFADVSDNDVTEVRVE